MFVIAAQPENASFPIVSSPFWREIELIIEFKKAQSLISVTVSGKITEVIFVLATFVVVFLKIVEPLPIILIGWSPFVPSSYIAGILRDFPL